ncbi:hypothetical protein SLU01_11700 [Sporosarcina luteola]|uniref:Uncharacterized protein n=1 Tax=Sporosarcina luteola TaxID=582850 RepID=A0A511Z5X5_9BACL|nr:hypothetical protein SLU01_11700 [Sporosarcina luteola]
MLDHILVETTLTYKPYPCDTKDVSNYITKFLEKKELGLIEKYICNLFKCKFKHLNGPL